MSTVKFEFSIQMVDQDSLTGEVWVLSFLGNEYKGVTRKLVIDTEVEVFSTFRGGNKKLSLMSPVRDTRLGVSLSEDLVA